VGFLALSVLAASSVTLWVMGRRYARRYRAIHGTIPPATWMFRRTDDPELEDPRRFALLLLPIDLVALVAYFLRP
jgi:hypothetical protein